MADELKPCPFCGASGENLGLLCDPAEGSDNSGPSRRVQCYGCNIEAPFYDSADEAIVAWNDRPAPKADSALAGELRDILAAQKSHCDWTHDKAVAGFMEANGATILAALSDRDVVLEEAAKVADQWCDENKLSKAKAAKQGNDELAAMLDGAAIECHAIGHAIHALKGGVDE